jgi:AcrR family transcriptional regulator
VLRAVAEQYIRGERVDVTIVARRLGIGRATIYRWFGSREALLGEVLAHEFDLLDVFDRINRTLASSRALRRLLEQERNVAMRLLTSSDGIVQPRAVACIEALIAAEVAAGTFDPPADPRTLAYAIVRLAEAFLYNDTAIGIRGDHERLREVEAALLGVRTPENRVRTPENRASAADDRIAAPRS